jgi:Fe-S-cluster-containing dehydrogenase component
MAKRYGMVIDLKRCVGCRSCQVACKATNFTPPGVFFSRVLLQEKGKYPYSKLDFVPVQCNQCQNPACVSVCPTGATSQRADGIVTVDAKKCIGCRYCMIACPYRQRFYLPIRPKKRTYFPAGPTPHELQGKKTRDYAAGTVIKCDFCLDAGRLDKGLEPACVQTCISKARYFGDLNDPESEVSQLIITRGGFQLLPGVGTDPSIYYLR